MHTPQVTGAAGRRPDAAASSYSFFVLYDDSMKLSELVDLYFYLPPKSKPARQPRRLVFRWSCYKLHTTIYKLADPSDKL